MEVKTFSVLRFPDTVIGLEAASEMQ